MPGLARFRVLVASAAVERGQAVRVPGKVAGHPIHEHADASLMERIDEGLEIVRRSKAAGRCEVANRLVAPRLVERMLGDGQQLDMRIAELDAVLGQLLGEVSIIEEVVVVWHALP
jgi:hypothetical protein